jgi:hypothetical protein
VIRPGYPPGRGLGRGSLLLIVARQRGNIMQEDKKNKAMNAAVGDLGPGERRQEGTADRPRRTAGTARKFAGAGSRGLAPQPTASRGL